MINIYLARKMVENGIYNISDNFLKPNFFTKKENVYVWKQLYRIFLYISERRVGRHISLCLGYQFHLKMFKSVKWWEKYEILIQCSTNWHFFVIEKFIFVD